ncbi:hypothetical protein ACP70R_047359 [Stipagrostis hirtigluma subsp. patula]
MPRMARSGHRLVRWDPYTVSPWTPLAFPPVGVSTGELLHRRGRTPLSRQKRRRPCSFYHEEEEAHSRGPYVSWLWRS